ncbi:MAG: glycoside hydrolase family 78 protein [Spirochaetaceae bacterium]
MDNLIFGNSPGYWTAKWMELPNSDGNNSFFRIRHNFKIEEKPKKSTVYISARLKYRLLINGEYIGEGPARSSMEEYSYDSYVLTGGLNIGENIISIVVNHYGELPGAFLFQMNMVDHQGISSIISSDENWLYQEALEYKNRTQLYGYADYSEVYDYNTKSNDWKKAEYLDPFNSMTTKRKKPVAMPFLDIIPRDIPKLNQDIILPGKVFKYGESPLWQETGENFGEYMAGEIHLPLSECSIKNKDALLDSSDKTCDISRPAINYTVSEFKGLFDPFIILDFGKLLNGYICIEAETEDGCNTMIDIGYSDRIYYDRVITQPYRGLCSADRVIMGSEPVAWKSFYWRQFRYVQISVRDLTGVLKIKKIHVMEQAYPFKSQGAFYSSNKELNRLWDMTKKTIELCTSDNFMDNGLREKQPWTGDIATIVLGTLAIFGDDPIIRRYIATNMSGQKNSGLIPGHWPETSVKAHSVTKQGNILWFEHPMALMLRMSEYYIHGGHSGFIKKYSSHFRNYVNTLEKYENPDSVLEEIPGQHWVDWAALNMTGISFITNLWYSEILKLASELNKSDKDFSERCLFKAESIRTFLIENLWDRELNLFVDSINQSGEQTYSEHSNYSALLYGLVPVNDSDRFIQTVSDADIIRVEPSFMYTPIMALMSSGHIGKALEMISQRYKIWLDGDYDTLPEEWHPNATFRDGYWKGRIRALAQAASCGLPFTFHRGILGVNPTSNGYKTFTVSPAIDYLEMCSGTVPTPYGSINVDWKRENQQIVLTIESPESAIGELIVPKNYSIQGISSSGELVTLTEGITNIVLHKVDSGVKY